MHDKFNIANSLRIEQILGNKYWAITETPLIRGKVSNESVIRAWVRGAQPVGSMH